MSSEDESSDSSNEFLVPASKIDLTSSFFSSSTSKPTASTSKSPRAKVRSRIISSSSESDDDIADTSASNADLLLEVMKNLEKLNNINVEPSASASSSSGLAPTVTKSPKKQKLSTEIADLLLKHESGLGSFDNESDSSGSDAEQEVQKNQEKPPDYSIPKEGVNITLPGTGLPVFNRKKKKVDFEAQLIKRMNARVRSNQLLVHKVGLLCWLAHGFHLNQQINDPEVMSIVLSLIPTNSYPKGRINIKYIQQFTRWFRGTIKIEFNKENSPVTKEILVERLKDKKVRNYREWVLLFIAALRAIGCNSRLVLSLCPPVMKPKSDQLFRVKKEEEGPKETKVKKEKVEEDIGVRLLNARAKAKGRGRGRGRGNGRVCENRKDSVVGNSKVADKFAKEEAKKRAAELLREKFARGKEGGVKKLKRNEAEGKEDNKEKGVDEDGGEEIKGGERGKKLKRSEEVVEEKRGKKLGEDGEESEEEEKGGKRLNKLKNDKEKEGKGLKRLKRNEDIKEEKKIKMEEDGNVKERKEGSRSMRSRTKKEENKKMIKKEEVESKKRSTRSQNKDKKIEVKKMDVDDEDEEEKEEEEDGEEEESDDSEKEFSEKKKLGINRLVKEEVKKKNYVDKRESVSDKSRKVLSSEDEDEEGEVIDVRDSRYLWVEVYVEDEESWITVSVPDEKVHCVSDIYKKAPSPVLYVIAWNSIGTIKDVTRRYCPHWLTVTRKQRIDQEWWSDTLSPWIESNSALSRAEDESLLTMEMEQPLPDSISNYKGHPLYALARHLLKYEALYPPDCVPIAHLKNGEAVYSRHCVHTLRSRETWLKEARVVKPSQEPYKIVKAMPKMDKFTGQLVKDQPLELFGKWQTNQYDPPQAKNGIVPRNEYGNVDLFKQCMLPKGTVHIDLPGLLRLAKKLKIDCVPAVVGFNFGCRGAMPMTQGYVVCEEHEDTLRDAWEQEQIDAVKRAKDKRDKRIWGNWRKLIRGVLIKEKIAIKYDMNNSNDDDNNDNDEDESNDKKNKNKVPAKRLGKNIKNNVKKRKV
ncbi:DNA repair protein complementing XP-C cells homolog [Microplitis mediator]|uniref:DNA repair protein complementing XP-C cells homolog n=1 Tax=Microplitis mediator TaxID=375433 RepID=UPI002553C21B|nr:DNA repair protein complementing XP-C cells homolog [Microplitis mediator]